MKIVDIRCNADARLVVMAVAHGLAITGSTLVLTDSVEYTRIGERVGTNEGVYRCGEVYTAIVPTLFLLNGGSEEFKGAVDAGVNMAKQVTGEDFDSVVLAWSGTGKFEADVSVRVVNYKQGLVTRDENEYVWVDVGEAQQAGLNIPTYVLMYSKSDMKKSLGERIEKVLVTGKEMDCIQSMEKLNKLKIVAGGCFSVAEDIAVKYCGVSGGAFKGILQKFA